MNYPYGYGTGSYNPYTTQQMQPVQQMQNGFISVASEQEARMYPLAPGNSITFKDETQPYVYVKTQGFNQMETPVFKKYRLVEEEAATEAPTDALKSLSDKVEQILALLSKEEANV